jgi:hypothetical protein
VSEEQIRRADNAAYQKIEQEGGVLLHLDTGAYHQVNDVGALIWELLATSPSRAELLAELRKRIDNPPDHLAEDVDEFLRALHQRNLVIVESNGAP